MSPKRQTKKCANNTRNRNFLKDKKIVKKFDDEGAEGKAGGGRRSLKVFALPQLTTAITIILPQEADGFLHANFKENIVECLEEEKRGGGAPRQTVILQ